MAKRVPKQILAIALKIAEGVNRQLVDSIARDIEMRPGIILLDLRRRPERNSTIIKFAGEKSAVLEWLIPICRTVFQNLDYSASKKHPHAVGVITSLTFIPIRGISFSEGKSLLNSFAPKYAAAFSQPTFCTGLSSEPAIKNQKKKLSEMSDTRIQSALRKGDLKPDFGPNRYNPKQGITLVGLRKFIVTLILYLDTRKLDIAQDIADTIGLQGKKVYDENQQLIKSDNGEYLREKGKYPTVMTLALSTSSEGLTQIVCNLNDYENPTIVQLYQTAQKIARQYQTAVMGCNIIGYLPLHVFEVAHPYLPDSKKIGRLSFSRRLDRVMSFMNLSIFGEFNPRWQIIDFRFIPYNLTQ